MLILNMKKRYYSKIIGFCLLVFVLGGIAGILGSQILLPWLANFSPFNKIGWVCRVKEGTTIINRTERVVVTPDAAYQDAIAKLSNSVVAVRTERQAGGKTDVLAEGTGFVLTGDGLIVTVNNLLPKGANRVIIIRNNQEFEAITVKEDDGNNLVLLKIADNNLPVVALGDRSNLKLGETVFLIGSQALAGEYNRFVSLGFVRSVLPEIGVNFSENQLANGGPLVNIKGEVLGSCLVDKTGRVNVVTEDKIRQLMK